MKFLVASLLVVVLLIVCPSSLAAKICVSNVETCNDNVPVCGRFGGSNLCKNFKNRCEFEIFNCASKTPYRIVNGNMCTGIPVNTRTFCNGLQNGPVVGGGKFPHWYGKKPGFGGCKGKKCGGHKGGVEVQPIVINRGK
ncbi:uncharacterized protein LOC111686929 [Lucilia cuprina]|uniref:uncharacterized protein LOC111686929 n=1 Tax=Lucilia cuprina TaxID=7375 RepID=UPI001F062314|nr:uncharacterized protein LOC111686929 [Lucilia cuprina]